MVHDPVLFAFLLVPGDPQVRCFEFTTPLRQVEPSQLAVTPLRRDGPVANGHAVRIERGASCPAILRSLGGSDPRSKMIFELGSQVAVVRPATTIKEHEVAPIGRNTDLGARSRWALWMWVNSRGTPNYDELLFQNASASTFMS